MSQLESSADVDAFIKRLEEQSATRFVTFSVDRQYNDKDWQPLPMNRVHWRWARGSGMPAIEFTGIPFMFVGSKRLVCHQGKDLAISQKRKYFEEKARKMLEEQSFGSQKSRQPTTKKMGCPAAVSISKIAAFPKFKVDDNTERSKRTASKLLRTALVRDAVVWETHYVVTHSSEHAGHVDKKSKRDVTSKSVFPPRKRAKKVDLRKKCIKLTEQLMDSLQVIEDQRTLENLSQVLGSLLNDLLPLSSRVDRKPLPLVASPLSQRCLGRQIPTNRLDSLTKKRQEPPC